ncbi:MAG: BBP7 family outer membrane beta-barrel protein, partial [Planctomycetia bacterium]
AEKIDVAPPPLTSDVAPTLSTTMGASAPLWQAPPSYSSGSCSTEPCFCPQLGRYFDDAYFTVEALYWKPSEPGGRGQILNTTSPDPNSPNPAAPTQVPLVGFRTGTPNPDYEWGVQALVGTWLNESMAVEVGGFWSNPFLLESLEPNPLSAPGIIGGTATFAPTNIPLERADAYFQIENHSIQTNARFALWRGAEVEIDGLTGLRYIGYDEEFILNSRRTQQAGGGNVSERFHTGNEILSWQLGAESSIRLKNYFYMRSLLAYGLGGTFQNLDISRRSDINGGFLTGNGSNLGSSDRTSGTQTAELAITAEYRVTPNIRFRAGYQWLWISDVLRAMDQLDFPGMTAGSPIRTNRESDVWLQGFTCGLHVDF